MLLSSLAFISSFLLSLLLVGAGKRLIRALHIVVDNAFEELLYSFALGVLTLEIAVSLGELLPNVRFGVVLAVCVVLALGLLAIGEVFREIKAVCIRFRLLPREQVALGLALLGVVALEGLAAMAPLTGSDAMRYHFTVPGRYLQDGFHADWGLLHGFFCGLGHQLILAGLALGSEEIAKGLIFAGGVAASLATLRLAQNWVPGRWAFAIALAFTLTPVVFWQTAAAGAPDIWMCALLPLAVLAILAAERSPSAPACVLAGILTGGLAGAKYTGILMAGALLIAFVVEIRSFRKGLTFFAAAVAAGFWPYLRNFWWTGDPIFPFFFARRPQPTMNLAALGSLLKDTGASNPHEFARVMRFPLFAIADHDGLATWQLLGPLILALAPIAIWSVRRTALWRVALIVWLIVSIGVGMTSGIPRFLLPVLPVALASSIGGVVLLTRTRFPLLRWTTVLTIAAFCLAGFAALAIYSRPAWSVALGRDSRDAYLRVHAPDFERSQFVNTNVTRLAGTDRSARVLIFYRHLYYLRVPFLLGDPLDNWEMSPSVLNSDEQWRALFARDHVRWVVKASGYPIELATSLAHLEATGVLKPCAGGTVRTLQGFRMYGQLADEPITLMCVTPNGAASALGQGPSAQM